MKGLGGEKDFTGKANLYDSCRPGYPDSYIDYLYSEIGFNNSSIVADVGSGTGILTEKLLERGSIVYGIEPNADMRKIAE